MIKSIIFDLDGTLIDSMKIWYQIDRRFLIENGVKNPPREISERMKKMTIDDSAELFISEFNLNLTKEYVIKRIEELVRTEYEENIPLKPNVSDLLDFLDSRNIRYCVATATYKSLAEAVLRRCGIISRFDFILTDEEYPRGKKFPDIFMGACERFGTLPSETLVAEDSLHSIETAKNAGFPVAAVYDESAEPDSGAIKRLADYYFNSVYEIKDLIK
ncbi:MAG: HAD family phosphatase [Ruminococcus flavefaciens]|nr:HAD family phosphatase [Ruminococcus flavefaciens]MCM1229743.1 HAD family phosphatase [Ruminococcus flavefaciens]